MPSIPEWFSGSRLNYGENLLQGNDEDIAIYAAGFITFHVYINQSTLHFNSVIIL